MREYVFQAPAGKHARVLNNHLFFLCGAGHLSSHLVVIHRCPVLPVSGTLGANQLPVTASLAL
ncbi:hypothetical protein OP862_01240 [Yersinia massiliensis]|uniref:hypothetical protein n=1 Tax=Yersinia massiliensis TaxID=419257 RepID=UPI0022404543|nr:hypothetical protein [Yersinia massiliensis]MDA5549173.1 hypothetical protein [Yersinia massiliensis]UZM79349.1 hypothetical protein OP862_01240 [Yersinia massiliensis]